MTASFPKFKIAASLACLLALWLSAIPLQATASVVATAPGHSLTSGKSWAQMPVVEKTQTVCALSAVLIFFVAEIMFIVAGFKSSVGWGLFMLFIGGTRSILSAIAMIAWMVRWMLFTQDRQSFQAPALILGVFVVFAGGGAIVFIIRHWERARRPLAALGFAVALILAVIALQLVK